MSGSVGLSILPFTDAEKVDIRRFCGYPPYGQGASGFIGYRFFQAYGELEYRLNNMAPAEMQNIRLKLADLYVLEAAVPASATNLDTAVAAVWTHNPNEVRDRMKLLASWSRRLCGIVGVPPGPSLGDAGLRFIV